MKKIKSELNIKNDSFKIKIGTIDKKNPNVIYYNIGCYIMPKIKKTSYSNYISNIEYNIKKLINDIINNNNIFKKNFIFVSDIADERIVLNKKSFLEIQIFFNLNNNFKLPCKFSELAKIINEKCIKLLITNLKETIETNNFECYLKK